MYGKASPGQNSSSNSPQKDSKSKAGFLASGRESVRGQIRQSPSVRTRKSPRPALTTSFNICDSVIDQAGCFNKPFSMPGKEDDRKYNPSLNTKRSPTTHSGEKRGSFAKSGLDADVTPTVMGTLYEWPRNDAQMLDVTDEQRDKLPQRSSLTHCQQNARARLSLVSGRRDQSNDEESDGFDEFYEENNGTNCKRNYAQSEIPHGRYRQHHPALTRGKPKGLGGTLVDKLKEVPSLSLVTSICQTPGVWAKSTNVPINNVSNRSYRKSKHQGSIVINGASFIDPDQSDENDSADEESSEYVYEKDMGDYSVGCSSTLASAWNILNMIQGIGVLGLPYAFSVAGWASIVGLVFITVLTCHTANLVADCVILKKIPIKQTNKKGTKRSYQSTEQFEGYQKDSDDATEFRPHSSKQARSKKGSKCHRNDFTAQKSNRSQGTQDNDAEFQDIENCKSNINIDNSYKLNTTYACIGKLVSPKYGFLIISAIVTLELFGAMDLYYTLMGSSGALLAELLGYGETLDQTMMTVIIAVFSLPLLLTQNMKMIAWFSLCAMVCQGLTMGLIFTHCILDISERGLHTLSWYNFAHPKLSKIPGALGVLIFSYCVHGIIPGIKINLKNPKSISSIFAWCFTGSTFMKVAFGLLTSLLFGENTSQTIAENLKSRQSIFVSASLVIGLNAFFSVPILAFAIVRQFDMAILPRINLMNPEDRGPNDSCATWLYNGWIFTSRTGLVAAVVFTSIMVPEFSLVMGLVGVVTGSSICLILPAWVNLGTFRWKLTKWQRIQRYGIIAFGLVVTVVGTIVATQDLIDHVNAKK